MSTSKPPFSWPVVPAVASWAADDLAVSPIDAGLLSPVWQMLLLGDGSPTRQLALLTSSPTHVDLLDAISLGDDLCSAPKAVSLVAAPRVRRRVVLENARGERLMHAVSWWNSDAYRRFLSDPGLPIGTSLVAARLEIFRQMVDLHTGTAPAGLFFDGSPSGTVWARSYLMFNRGHAIALVHEVFSPILQRVVGPYRLLADAPLQEGAKQTEDRPL